MSLSFVLSLMKNKRPTVIYKKKTGLPSLVNQRLAKIACIVFNVITMNMHQRALKI